MKRKEKLIKKYFLLGLQQKEILSFLKVLHHIEMSKSTLKRILSKLKLYRRKEYSNIHDVISFLQQEINKSSQMVGYRWMHLKCLQNGIVVTQDIIRELLKLIDPIGVNSRKNKRLRRRQYINQGPNFLWHMDSYDKLKPYGICINGCIDGFSRYIIWLKAGPTSSDPKVIAGYYWNSIKELGGCPKTIRSDLGTENGTTEKIQIALRELFGGENQFRPAFLCGRSTANQRIERWWSVLRKQNAQFWMNLFETLRDDGLFRGTYLDKSLIQFCFLSIIQDELDEVAKEWNVHKIRKTKNSNAPTGRPIIMYQLYESYGAENYLMEIPSLALDVLKDECIFHERPCDENIFDLCTYIMVENGFTKSHDCYDAIDLYVNLRNEIYTLLELR